MARTKQTARKSMAQKVPKKQLAVHKVSHMPTKVGTGIKNLTDSNQVQSH